jgi:hypothetical protein
MRHDSKVVLVFGRTQPKVASTSAKTLHHFHMAMAAPSSALHVYATVPPSPTYILALFVYFS